jgi:hypothetical protein
MSDLVELRGLVHKAIQRRDNALQADVEGWDQKPREEALWASLQASSAVIEQMPDLLDRIEKLEAVLSAAKSVNEIPYDGKTWDAFRAAIEAADTRQTGEAE